MPDIITFSPDGRLLAVGMKRGGKPRVAVFDVETLEPVFRHEIATSGNTTAIAFAANGDLAIGFRDTIEIFSAGTWARGRTWDPRLGAVERIAFSNDGRYLAGSSNNVVVVFDLKNDTQPPVRLEMRGDGPGDVRSMAFSPNGQYLAAVGELNTGAVWEAPEWREAVFVRHSEFNTIASLSFADTASEAVSCGWDGTCIGWSLDRGVPVHRFAHQYAFTGGDAKQQGIMSGAFASRTSLFLTGGADGSARLWDLGPVAEAERSSCEGDLFVRTFTPDGRSWNRQVGNNLRIVERTCRAVRPAGVTFDSPPVTSPTGTYAASDLPGDVVRVWEALTGKIVAELPHSEPVDWEAVAQRVGAKLSERAAELAMRELKAGSVDVLGVSPSGRYVATFRRSDRTFRIWDSPSHRVVLSEVMEHAPFLEFLSDTSVLRVDEPGDDEPGTVTVRQLPSGSSRQLDSGSSVRALAISNGGRRIAVAGTAANGTAIGVWDAESGTRVLGQRVDSKVVGVTFDRAGRYVAALLGSADHVPSGLPQGVGLKIWELSSGREVLSLPASDRAIAFDFSPDGTQVAVVLRNGELVVRRTASGETAKRSARRRGPSRSTTPGDCSHSADGRSAFSTPSRCASSRRSRRWRVRGGSSSAPPNVCWRSTVFRPAIVEA